jgi:shikimate dehydrogenase
MNLVTGTTTVYAMLGHPVAQVQSPILFNTYFRDQRIDAVMPSLDIAPEGIDDFFRFLRHWHNCPGCIITVPHKQAAFRNADRVSQRAERVGACNLIRRLADGELEGDMVDGLGFTQALAQQSISLAGANIIQIGAGGVGSAMAHAAADAGAASIAIMEIDEQRRRTLVDSLREHHPGLIVYDNAPGPVAVDVIANATPLGMKPDDDPFPYPLDAVDDHVVVTDVVTLPPITPWLEAARARGCRIQTGPQMARAQMLMFARYLGIDIDEQQARRIIGKISNS